MWRLHRASVHITTGVLEYYCYKLILILPEVAAIHSLRVQLNVIRVLGSIWYSNVDNIMQFAELWSSMHIE